MQYELINQTRALLVVPLRSGASLHIGPGKQTGPVEDFEITGSEKIAKMQKLGLLKVVLASQ